MRFTAPQPYLPEEEAQLVRQLRLGDQAAFDRIFRHYYQQVLAFAINTCGQVDLAEEVTQEVFLKLWEKRSTLDQSKSFKSFLFIVCRNTIINHIRKQNSKRKYEDYLKTYQSFHTENTAETVRANEVKTTLSAAISALPPKRQQVFRLSREQGLSYKEIAHQLRISPKTVEVHISQALKFIRRQLEQQSDVAFLWGLMILSFLLR